MSYAYKIVSNIYNAAPLFLLDLIYKISMYFMILILGAIN